MTPAQIRLTIEELRTRTRPEQRTTYESTLLALAGLVDQATAAIDGQVMREMNQEQFNLIHDLRGAIPHNFSSLPKEPA